MTEPGDAAWEEARRLGRKEAGPPGTPWPNYEAALARVLQEHSDVARKAHAVLDGLIGTGAIRDGLQTLILPDEPCNHRIDPFSPSEGLRCVRCHVPLKIVEAGNG